MKTNLEKEKRDILEIISKERDTHFNKNAKAMADMISDDFISVNAGSISHPKYESMLKMFTDYFNSVEFIKWDDKKPPIVRFSKDASVAYVAVEKLVILKGLNKSGKEVIDTLEYAWISVYKKEKNQWQLDAIASTNK
jgi:ketosteroid isomerase-like protein